MKKYQYLASWDDQTLTRVGEPVVVLGDSNVSQVEVTLPSNFLLDPTKAECRMYFLLPGEKESAHEVLETATKDENGDNHVTWTIKHVHSQKDGRLAFSLTLIGDDAQWDSRTAIIPVYESRYQPESEEAEEPYTGRLDALEGSMAAIRGEFSEVQEAADEATETASAASAKVDSAITKADAVDERLDNIIIESGTSEAEVVAARTNSDTGTTYNTLGARLDTEYSEIKEDLGNKSKLETFDKTNIVSAINSLNGVVRTIANRDTSWAGIRENVKSGYGEILYPVGTDFSVSCPSGAPYNDIVFTVVNHRVENDEPIMTLLTKHVIYGIQFDAIQAMICPSEPMPAGTYHFKLLDGHDTAYDGGKYVQFTLANALEAGGQIVINWPYNQTWIGKNATVYHAFGTTAVETCVMSEGAGGTYLGVADGTVSILNHTHRGRYGSNNYAESAVREWLNSDGAAGAWQTQKTKFQRPCSYNASKAGFVTYLDPEFVAIVRSGSHPNRTNQVFDLNGTKQAYSTTDKFYLLSNEEVGFTSESGIVCGTVLDFYKEAAQKDKIKYDITSQATARNWWLRLPFPSYAHSERAVGSSGALNSSYANNGFGAAAACEI